jgi:hypothetical protein
MTGVTRSTTGHCGRSGTRRVSRSPRASPQPCAGTRTTTPGGSRRKGPGQWPGPAASPRRLARAARPGEPLAGDRGPGDAGPGPRHHGGRARPRGGRARSRGTGHHRRGGKRGCRQRARIGALDPALTAHGGLAAVSEPCDRLVVIEAVDAATGLLRSSTAGTAPGSCWPGSQRHSWPERTSWPGWTGYALMRPGSSSRRCQDCRPRPPLGWPARSRPASGRP